MVVLAGQGIWLAHHVAIGHLIGIVTLALPILVLMARLPRPIFFVAIGLVLLYVLQYAFVNADGGSYWRAFHAVNAPLLFVSTLYLGWRTYTFTRRSSRPPEDHLTRPTR
jgi:hypothetical protein